MGLLAAALGAAVLAACVRVAPDRPSEAGEDGVPYLLVWEGREYRYEYHVPTGTQCLVTVAADGSRSDNVLAAHPEIAAEALRALAERYGVASLDALGARYADTIRRLRSLGYL